MSVTPEHIAEAKRRLKARSLWGIEEDHPAIAELLAEALASPAWVPPVDPDLVLAEQHGYPFGAPGHIAFLSGIRASRAAERAGGE